jgi:hypothetical protein
LVSSVAYIPLTGHPVFVERTGHLKANAMVSQLSLEQIILLRAQVKNRQQEQQ